jgi:hypothetical protein
MSASRQRHDRCTVAPPARKNINAMALMSVLATCSACSG